MNGLNRVEIIGNLGSEPEMRYMATGKALTTFRVAVNRRYRDGEGQLQEKVNWFRCTAWGRLAEVSNQYCDKGSPVYVSGRLETRSYEGNDGQLRYVTEIVVQDLILLPRGNNGAGVIPVEGEEETAAEEEEEVEVPL